MPIGLRAFVLGLFVVAPALAHAAGSSALVIGINEYTSVPSLDGAANDAQDIAAALSRNGSSRVLILTNGEATKANIVNAWNTLLADAQPGDTIFVTYAGHGAQLKQLKEGDERDGLDEFWVLPGFDPKNLRETWRESVFDNELHNWFTDAGKKGVKVVLVSDSCHSGGMDRAVRGKKRYVEFGNSRVLSELFAMVSGSVGTASAVEQLPENRTPDNVTMLAATAEALPVPEVVIEGQSRGALSWAFARAVEGKADRDGDGAVTRIELEDYVMSTVRMRSESLQNPVFTPVVARRADESMFTLSPVQSMLTPWKPPPGPGIGRLDGPPRRKNEPSPDVARPGARLRPGPAARGHRHGRGAREHRDGGIRLRMGCDDRPLPVTER